MRRFRISFFFLMTGILLGGLYGCDTPSSVEDPDLHHFIKYYGGDGDQYGVDMLALDDGTFLLLGNYSETAYTDLYLVRADAEGEVLWERRIRGEDEFVIFDAKDLEATNDGNFVVLADFRRGVGSQSEIKLFKISPAGVPIDSVGYSTYSTAPGVGANDFGISVTSLTDGGFLVSGITEYTATYHLAGETDPDLGDVFNFRVDAGLTPRPGNDWSPVVHGFGSNLDVAVKTVERTDGAFYVFGYTNSTLTNLNPNERLGLFYFYRGPSGSLGDIYYPGNIVNVNDTEINHVAPLPIELGGGFIVIGTSINNVAVSEIFVARMRTALTFSSIENDATLYNTISLGRNIRGVSAAPSLTGEFGYLILGNEVRSTGTNIWLSKINQNGNVLWSTTLGSEAQNDYGAAVAQLPDGKIMILGTIRLGDSQSKMALIKVHSGGKFLK